MSGCDVVDVRIGEVASGGCVRERTLVVRQRPTSRVSLESKVSFAFHLGVRKMRLALEMAGTVDIIDITGVHSISQLSINGEH